MVRITRPVSATVLATGRKAKVRLASNGRLLITGLPASPPDPLATTIKVRFAAEPRSLAEEDKSAWLTGDAE